MRSWGEYRKGDLAFGSRRDSGIVQGGYPQELGSKHEDAVLLVGTGSAEQHHATSEMKIVLQVEMCQSSSRKDYS